MKIRRYIAENIEGVGDARGWSYLGILAYHVYLGLGDEESVRYLDALADKVNEAIKEGEGLVIGPWESMEAYEQLLAHIQAMEFLTLHYALSGDPDTKMSIKVLAGSLAENLGWRPENSYSRFLAYSLFVRTILGLTPLEEDVKEIESELSARYMDLMNYSAQSLSSQITILTMLSHYVIASKSLEGPLIELEALRKTLENLTIAELVERKIKEEEYWIDAAIIHSLVMSYIAGEDDHVLQVLKEKIQEIFRLWIDGSEPKPLPFPKIFVYMFDPKIRPEELFVEEFVWKRDLIFPSTIALFASSIRKVDEEFSTWVNGLLEGIVEKVSQQVNSMGYYDVGAGEYVGRLESAYLISSWLALAKKKYETPGEVSPRLPTRLPYTLIASFLILVSIAVYYKVRIRREAI